MKKQDNIFKIFGLFKMKQRGEKSEGVSVKNREYMYLFNLC